LNHLKVAAGLRPSLPASLPRRIGEGRFFVCSMSSVAAGPPTPPIDLEGGPLHTGRRCVHCLPVGATNAGFIQDRSSNSLTKAIFCPFDPSLLMTFEPPPGLPRRRFSCLQPAVSRTRPVINALSRVAGDGRIAETPRASRLPCPARSASSPFLSDWTPPIGWEGGPVHIRVRCAHSLGAGETTTGFHQDSHSNF
jgi:hypothetical protein